jgi:Amt family ammonium transporter
MSLRLCAFAALIYAFVITYILAILVDKTPGLRVTEEEYAGPDISRHGVRA